MKSIFLKSVLLLCAMFLCMGVQGKKYVVIQPYGNGFEIIYGKSGIVASNRYVFSPAIRNAQAFRFSTFLLTDTTGLQERFPDQPYPNPKVEVMEALEVWDAAGLPKEIEELRMKDPA